LNLDIGNLCISSTAATIKSANVGVLVSNMTDPCVAQIKQDLENLQKNIPLLFINANIILTLHFFTIQFHFPAYFLKLV